MKQENSEIGEKVHLQTDWTYVVAKVMLMKKLYILDFEAKGAETNMNARTKVPNKRGALLKIQVGFF